MAEWDDLVRAKNLGDLRGFDLGRRLDLAKGLAIAEKIRLLLRAVTEVLYNRR